MKRNLYQKKCDNYITIEEFKQKYEKIKKEILQIQEQMQIIDKANKLLEENIEKLAYKNLLTNNFIKKIIEKIEIYPENKIEITFNM